MYVFLDKISLYVVVIFKINKMKSNTSMTIRLNKSIKQQAQQLFSDLGIDMTTAINLFLRQAIQNNGLPFRICKNPNKTTISAINDAIDGNMIGPFNCISDLMDSLNA